MRTADTVGEKVGKTNVEHIGIRQGAELANLVCDRTA